MVFECTKTLGLTPMSGCGKVNVCSFLDNRTQYDGDTV